MHCDYTVHVSVDLSLLLGTLAPKHIHLFRLFPVLPRREVGMDVQTRWSKVDAKLLLNVNRKSYMPRRLALGTTTDDLE